MFVYIYFMYIYIYIGFKVNRDVIENLKYVVYFDV